MPGSWDLEIDTYWIRRAAGSMDGAALAFGTVTTVLPPLTSAGLGASDTAAAVAVLVNARNQQARAAATQLRDVTTAIGNRLRDAAATFDRLETGVALPNRGHR